MPPDAECSNVPTCVASPLLHFFVPCGKLRRCWQGVPRVRQHVSGFPVNVFVLAVKFADGVSLSENAKIRRVLSIR